MPPGVCSPADDSGSENGAIKHVDILGGCNGNPEGHRQPAAGYAGRDAIERMKGIPLCGIAPTSCPDQLATALQEALEQTV